MALVMIEYQVINRLIFQPKHMLEVLKRTLGIRPLFKHQIINLNLICMKMNTILRSKLCLSRRWCIQYAGIIHFSEHVELVELETYQVIVGSYGQNAYLEETMTSSQTEFCANASLSSTVLCRKHNIFMYLGKYLVKLWHSVK